MGIGRAFPPEFLVHYAGLIDAGNAKPIEEAFAEWQATKGIETSSGAGAWTKNDAELQAAREARMTMPGPTAAFDSPPQPGGADLVKGVANAAADVNQKGRYILPAVALFSMANAANQVQQFGPNAQALAGTTTGLMAGADALGTHMINQAIKNPLGRTVADLGLKTATSGLQDAGIKAAKGEKPQWNLPLAGLSGAAQEGLISELMRRVIHAHLF
jgi:hypothetical protein